jgi:hypothetical protein
VAATTQAPTNVGAVSDSSSSGSNGAVIGGVVGGFLLVVVLVVVFVVRSRSKRSGNAVTSRKQGKSDSIHEQFPDNMRGVNTFQREYMANKQGSSASTTFVAATADDGDNNAATTDDRRVGSAGESGDVAVGEMYSNPARRMASRDAFVGDGPFVDDGASADNVKDSVTSPPRTRRRSSFGGNHSELESTDIPSPASQDAEPPVKPPSQSRRASVTSLV